MTKRSNVKRHLVRAGNSIPAAAKKLGFGEGTVRRAVDKGQIATVEFGGLKRITDAEIERVRALFGITEQPPENSAV